MRCIKFAVLSVIAVLAGCASAPQRNVTLDEARSAVEKLSAEPNAAQTASKPLHDARDLLAQADSAAAAHKPTEEVTHLAYLAHRHADLGEAVVAEAHAREQISQGEANRNRVLLEAREREVSSAKQETRDAKASAADAQSKAADAQAQAKDAQAQANAAKEAEEMARKQLGELQATQTERGMVLTLGNVLFDTAKETLSWSHFR